MSYVLLIDDELEILEVLEMTAQMVTSLPIKTSTSGNKAWGLIEECGEPTLVVCDYRMPDGDGVSLYTRFKSRYAQVPFIVCSGNPVDELKVLFEGANHYVSKPQFLKPLKELMTNVLGKPAPVVEYVSVPLAYLLRLGVIEVDAFIRLSDNKYVKVHQRGGSFDEEDFNRLQKKLLTHLFVTREDAVIMLERFQAFLLEKISAHDDATSTPKLSLDALEATAAFARALGWNAEIVKVAKSTVDLTMKMVTRDKGWQKILARERRSENFDSHISLLSLMSCMVAQEVGWVSEVTHQKLIMAALLHDHFVDEKAYEENSTSQSSRDFQQHPIKAAELACSLTGLPSDVDKILIQHHELPDGSGFPRGLTASHISPLSALFIICEKLISFSQDKPLDNQTINDFWLQYQMFLEHEPFKKIALAMIKKA